MATPAPLAGTVKIVSSLPRTGVSKSETDAIVNAIRMAIEEHGGKIGNATIQYQDMDDATAARGTWDAEREAENARQAAADGDVLLYLGPYNSGAAKVSLPILNRAGLPMLSPTNTYSGLTKKADGMTEQNEPEIYYPAGTQHYFRVLPTDEVQGTQAAGWARELGAKKVYLLDDTEIPGNGWAVAFQAAAREAGLEIAGGPEGIDPKASDYKAMADKIKSTGADTIYFGGISQNNAGRLWQDLKSAMPEVRLMGADGLFDNAFIDAAGPAAEGTLLTFGAVAPEHLQGKGAEFVNRYKDKYKQDPLTYTAYGYEAARVGLQAIQDCGRKERACVIAALQRIRDYDGALGTWSFTQTGDTTLTTVSGITIRNNAFQFDKVLGD